MTKKDFANITRDTIVVSLVTDRRYRVVSNRTDAILVVPEAPYETYDLDDNGCVTAFILNLQNNGDIGGCVDTEEYNYETFAIKD